MIIYNVTTKVATELSFQWLQWMREEQIPAIMSTGLFREYRISRLLEQDDEEGPTYVVQYLADSLEEYNLFVTQHQQALRQRAYTIFGDSFVAFNTVMEVI
ncbi:DUF4286 family protein [Chitinophaga polysaccharea]|uniref:DUF4286 family protein n=1 Tax=Chitinophaga TaxID=79328 RepID=UPI001454F81C|nr:MULTISPECIES: DUF4286 family protein [Chitinophaga]NLR59982.1 DUF4286 family protein [Chitinophaga polysaccharea]NLU94211.1 DUF4286 family protein [Chitinophaga sp. Ak27]